jgi:four helix bundle protein
MEIRFSRSAVAAIRGRVREQRQRQVAGTGTVTGAAVSVCETAVVTSRSFDQGSSRWAVDVKGKPVKPVSTLDIDCLTGSREGMNDPEVTMSNALTNTNLIAHEKALEAAGIAITLVMRVPAPLKSIADQVIRSASSVPANLAEGHGRTGRDRLHFWRIAYASAKEVDSHLKLLVQAGAVNGTGAHRAFEIFDEVRAMTWRLLNRKT